MINYLQPPLGYLVRIPCGDDAADSPLDEPARDRAEQAAAFFRFERIGQIFTADQPAARDAAEIVWQSCSWDFTDALCAGGAESFYEFLLDPDRGLPCVLVATQREIESALQRLGVSLANQPGDAPGASACGEIVAPGGIISLHGIAGEGACGPQIQVRARTMVLDFEFTDFVKSVAWGNADLAIEKPC
jgi:hypothetical protein